MKVLKFGGTSVGSADAIILTAEIIVKQSKNVCVVVSAMGGITNMLIDAGKLAQQKNLAYKDVLNDIKQKHLDCCSSLFSIQSKSEVFSEILVNLNTIETILEGIYNLEDLSEKTLALLSSKGEIMSSFILQKVLEKIYNYEATLLQSQNYIKVEESYLNGKLLKNETNSLLKKAISKKKNYVLPGFIASNLNGEICTLGRGGSDYTASIVANAVDASALEIWTDVSGMFTTNPKLVKNAFPIQHISYREALELSHFGAKVIYPPTIVPVLEKEIPIFIKNTFDAQSEGTKIDNKVNSSSIVSGISHIENIALLTLEGAGMVGIPGFSMRLFKALSSKSINVILITQASSEHSICIAIQEENTALAKKIIDNEFEYEISLKKLDPIVVESDVAIIALVGDNMKNNQGISGKMFYTLGKNNISIRAIAQGASERNISAVISKKHISKALNVLHESFFEEQVSTLNLFILGVGNVGANLLKLLNQQAKYLLTERKIDVRVVCLASSKKIILNADGINLNNWQKLLSNGVDFKLNNLLDYIQQFNLPNTIFVDNTASDEVSQLYNSLLKESVSVVTCNKIACSSELENYKNLKFLAKKYSASFLYETNVGAGLPIINTLQNLIVSGDRVTEIQAVLSGSLNFIFNNYNTTKSFKKIIEQAATEGYTEPDPRIDLSGIDVMRKILILARECGATLNLSNINNNSFLPKKAQKTQSVSEFLEIINNEEKHFIQLYENSAKIGAQLKFVAKYNSSGASVGLEVIEAHHPFFNLKGKDNMVIFYTDRYKEQPLIIKGAGAGAEVTASGVFSDIIKLAQH